MPPRIGRRSRLTTRVRTLTLYVRAGARLAEPKAPRLRPTFLRLIAGALALAAVQPDSNAISETAH